MLGALVGCASPSTASPPATPQPSFARDSLPCEDALQLRTSDAHPDIRWVVDDNVSRTKFLSCLLNWKKDTATLEAAAYLASGQYKFIGTCEASGQSIRRVFEYKNKSRPYLLRIDAVPGVDPYTYVVVNSFPRPSSGHFSHSIEQKTNAYERLKSCPPL
jgi:hypothetical protein